jgi:cholesterol transport system auxiliary component
MKLTGLPLITWLLALTGCSGVFDSTLPAPQAYILRLPPPAQPATAPAAAGSLLVQRPLAGPGLDSERIALLRSDRRFDFFAASRWAAPAPDLLESVLVDAMREAGLFSSVFDDSAPYAPHYNLRVTLRRFEADYTSGARAPTVYVVLDCTLGRHRDRNLLASFTAQGTAVATEDRLSAVVAAFETATAGAVSELERATTAALAAEGPATPAPAPAR